MTIEDNAGAFASGDDEALLNDVLSAGDGDDEGGTPPSPEPDPQPEPDPAPAPEPAPAAPAAPVAPPAPEPEAARHVPITALLDEREKRQALQRRLEELERAQAKPAAPAPEIWDAPDQYVQQHVAPVAQQAQQVRDYFSERLAVQAHGKETVDAALGSMEQAYRSGDPEARAAYNKIMSSPDPYEGLVEWHKRNEVVRNPEGFKARVADDLLKDPSFLARAAEALKATASLNPIVAPAQAGKSATALPSVSRVGTPAAVAAQVEDLADDELLASITRDERGRFVRR